MILSFAKVGYISSLGSRLALVDLYERWDRCDFFLDLAEVLT
jgi:hypothetical protein